jgi:hypothetical protein
MIIHLNCELIVNLTSKSNDHDGALKWISFCLDCDAPEKEGSVIRGLNAKYGPSDYSVTGELVYCVPNHAETLLIYNIHHFKDRIVFVDRGKISMFEKVSKIQKSQALGVVIADDGTCEEGFRYCRSRTGTVHDGGFAAFDSEEIWKEIEIPVILISFEGGERLRKLMQLQKVYVQGIGYQNVTAHLGDDGYDDEL